MKAKAALLLVGALLLLAPAAGRGKGNGRGKGRGAAGKKGPAMLPHLRVSPSETGPWAIETGLSRSDVSPALWSLATPSLRLWLQCPPSRLYSRRIHRAANASGVLPWVPTPRRFLVLDCHIGTLSHRIFCLRRHILLAGLLNRTLLLGDFTQGPPLRGLYSWELLFSIRAFHRCFGPESLHTVTQHLAAKGAAAASGKLRVHRLLLWSRDPAVSPDSFESQRGLELPEKEHASLQRDSPLSEWLRTYGGVQDEVLMVGDLYGALWALPDAPELLEIGDAPFARLPGCSSPYLFQTLDRILRLGKAFTRRFLRGPSSVAVHWQRQPSADFNCTADEQQLGVRGAEEGARSRLEGGEGSQQALRAAWRSSCNLSIDEVAGSIWRAIASTRAAKFVFLVTDASPEEVTKLKMQLFMVEKRVIRIRTSASALRRMLLVFPQEFRQAQDLLDRHLCAQAERFLGTYRSAFSLDVQRLRYAMGTATCRDKALCDDYLAPPELTASNSTTVEADFARSSTSGQSVM